MAAPVLADRRDADEDLIVGTTVTLTQFRAGLQGFLETRPWGSATAETEVYTMSSPIKLSQHAQNDLWGLFGNRAMPKILAALDQLATTADAGVTAWRHLGVGDYQVLYRPFPTARPEKDRDGPTDIAYLIARVVHRRDAGEVAGTVACRGHRPLPDTPIHEPALCLQP